MTTARLLDLACRQQAVFRLAWTPEASSHPGRPDSGVCVHVDEGRVVLRLARARAASEAVIMPSAPFRAGEDIRGDFCLAVAGKARVFRFESVILTHTDADLVEIARPARLEPWRRRRFPRIKPLPVDVLGLGVWDWNPARSCPTRPEGRPLLVRVPGRAENVRLTDISAAGAALRTRAATLAAVRNASGARLAGCLLLVCLRGTTRQPLLLWLACARRHATASAAHPGSVLLGLEIVRWAETADVEAPIFWKHPASGGEAPPLLAWTLKHQRLRYRRIHH